MAGYKSVSFDPSAMQTEINTASSVALIAAASAATAAASAATAAASAATAAASAATAFAKASGVSDAIASKSATWDKASDASAMLTSAIFSNPASGSFVVKEFVITSASAIKARYSSLAQG